MPAAKMCTAKLPRTDSGCCSLCSIKSLYYKNMEGAHRDDPLAQLLLTIDSDKSHIFIILSASPAGPPESQLTAPDFRQQPHPLLHPACTSPAPSPPRVPNPKAPAVPPTKA